MSNALKSVGKIFKKVVKAIKPLAKPLLIAGALYVTGGMLGMWGTGTAASAAAGGAAVPLAGAANAAPLIQGAAGTVASVAPTAAATAQGLGAMAAPAVAATAPAAGVMGGIRGAASSMLSFMQKNPAAAIIGGQALAGAFTPSQSDEAIRMDKYRRRNSSFYGVKGTSADPTGSDLGGLIATAQRSRLQSISGEVDPNQPANSLIKPRAV